jgi:CRP/FNR family transcriptional regulator, cyclic AMP receptor protein
MGLTASVLSLWIFPILLAILVLVAAWVGVRWYASEYVAALSGVPLLARLSPRQLRSVARSAARQQVAPSDRIVTQGEHADGFFLVEKGSVGVVVEGDHVATIGPGGYFGEMAVIDRGPRSATISAETPVTVLHLPSSELRVIVRHDPTIGDALSAELEHRLAEAGVSVPAAAADAKGIERLEILSGELRTVRNTDWGTVEPRRRSWFGR